MNEIDTLDTLKIENARLIALLEANGIEWHLPVKSNSTAPIDQQSSALSTADKIALFKRLFRGRPDIYPLRWESKTTGKSGYSPVCLNEWRPNVCHKPKIKCSDCNVRQLSPLTDAVIFKHLAGEHIIGVYPLLNDDSCWFLAIDFDEADWKADAQAFLRSCVDLGIPAALEISRSGNGAHVWIFFNQNVPAREARRLGTAIISHTCAQTRQLKLASYDRLFPNQDSMPKGGFGNLIALPLQKKPRENGYSVFVDKDLVPYLDQWAFLASISPLFYSDIEPIILKATGHVHPLDLTFIDEEDNKEPWKPTNSKAVKLTGNMPATLNITLANLIYFAKQELPQSLANKLIRLAAFQNPEFYKAQAMRFPVWNKPRVIGCAENYLNHIALPRGCIDSVQRLLKENGIELVINDERYVGKPIDSTFVGILRPDQEKAVVEMLKYDAGVLCAPTAFGKTVTAAAIIARRGVNTLILVHRTELLKQWHERLQFFLNIEKTLLGTIGGGKSKPTGKIDIAVMQSLSRHGDINPVVEEYGQVIVDECHHVGASSFDLILKQVKAKYVVGLTATPIRRDGQQPIIFMQCGPIRCQASKPENAPKDLEVLPSILLKAIDLPKDAAIQDVFRHIVVDKDRNDLIVEAIVNAFNLGRKVLVLTERTDHLTAILDSFQRKLSKPFVLHGKMSKKQRSIEIKALNELDDNAPRVLLAKGKLIGEGFDHSALDTLVLAMPISWKGTLQQYVGRLHREHVTKLDVQVIDFVDAGHPVLLRMWERRQKGYKAMGYKINVQADDGAIKDAIAIS